MFGGDSKERVLAGSSSVVPGVPDILKGRVPDEHRGRCGELTPGTSSVTGRSRLKRENSVSEEVSEPRQESHPGRRRQTSLVVEQL